MDDRLEVLKEKVRKLNKENPIDWKTVGLLNMDLISLKRQRAFDAKVFKILNGDGKDV